MAKGSHAQMRFSRRPHLMRWAGLTTRAQKDDMCRDLLRLKHG
jgi:hypothetical protein